MSQKMIMSLVKNLPTQWRETEEENELDQLMTKFLKHVIKIKGKIDRLIDEKPPNPVGTKDKNRSRKVLPVVQSFKINLLLR